MTSTHEEDRAVFFVIKITWKCYVISSKPKAPRWNPSGVMTHSSEQHFNTTNCLLHTMILNILISIVITKVNNIWGELINVSANLWARMCRCAAINPGLQLSWVFLKADMVTPTHSPIVWTRHGGRVRSLVILHLMQRYELTGTKHPCFFH